jgi:hypothetical protein
MSKAQYVLLVGFVGFYVLLFASLLVRACAGCFRARRQPGLPKPEKVSNTLAMTSSRSWTRAVWRGKPATETERMEHAAVPLDAHPRAI